MDDIEDEYDAYNLPLDAEHLPYILDLPPSRVHSPTTRGSPLQQADACESSTPQTPKSAISDEFSAYDLSEFTADELVRLELRALSGGSQTHVCDSQSRGAACGEFDAPVPASPNAKSHAVPTSRTLPHTTISGPTVDIELEQSFSLHSPRSRASPSRETAQKQKQKQTQAKEQSPKLKLVKGSWFRVTDLTAPAWCEYQFEYRQLLGMEEKKAEKAERPQKIESIVTLQGNTIPINVERVGHRKDIVSAGTSVHEKLEREIHPTQVVLPISSSAERWAARLVELINSLDSLITQGRCRELPVFGFVQGELVCGIIDEVFREPLPFVGVQERKRTRGVTSLPGTPSKRKQKKVSPGDSPSQPSLTSYFPALASNSSSQHSDTSDGLFHHIPHTPPAQYHLRLVDTKTRRHPSIPPAQDSAGSRFQLMIYHTLLSAMLLPAGSPGSTDFTAVWQRAMVSPSHKFSAQFVNAAQLPSGVNCLDELVKMLYRMVEMVGVAGLDPYLTIEYRTERSRWEVYERKRRERMKEEEESGVIVDDEAGVKMASAVPAVSEGALQGVVDGATDSADALRQHDAAIVKPTVVDIEDIAKGQADSSTKERNRRKGKSKASNSTSPAESEPESDADKYDSVVIGQQTFEYNKSALDTYMQDILQWWHGERPPRGVDIELTRRCYSCEFMQSCEWRAQKASEALGGTFGKSVVDLGDDPFATSAVGSVSRERL